MKRRILGKICVFWAFLICFFMISLPSNAASDKVSVYVLTKCSRNNNVFSYDKNGLLKKETHKSSFGLKYTDKFFYDGNARVKKWKRIEKGYNTNVTNLLFNYDNNNRLSGYKKVLDNNALLDIVGYTYNNKNQIVRCETYYSDYSGYTYSYNKKGLMAKSMSDSFVQRFQYDKHQNLRVGMKNIYDSRGLLKQRKESASLVIKYSYKKIMVSKKYLPVVRKQQWSLLNEGRNFAFGTMYSPIELGWS